MQKKHIDNCCGLVYAYKCSFGNSQLNTITKAVTKRSADHSILQRAALAEKRCFDNCKRLSLPSRHSERVYP